MASSKKPKGIVDDLLKAAAKAAAAGKAKLAKELRGKANVYMEDAAKAAKGKARLNKDWNSRISRYDYAAADAQKASSVSARLREEARMRGLKDKSRNIGKKESKDIVQALIQAAKRQEIIDAKRAAGGRNNPLAVKARQKKAANARKTAKPQTATGGAGKGPKNPQKTATASSPKKPKNNKK